MADSKAPDPKPPQPDPPRPKPDPATAIHSAESALKTEVKIDPAHEVAIDAILKDMTTNSQIQTLKAASPAGEAVKNALKKIGINPFLLMLLMPFIERLLEQFDVETIVAWFRRQFNK